MIEMATFSVIKSAVCILLKAHSYGQNVLQNAKNIIEAAILVVTSHDKKLIKTNSSKCQTDYRLTKLAI